MIDRFHFRCSFLIQTTLDIRTTYPRPIISVTYIFYYFILLMVPLEACVPGLHSPGGLIAVCPGCRKLLPCGQPACCHTEPPTPGPCQAHSPY